jgi:hypothetical protein
VKRKGALFSIAVLVATFLTIENFLNSPSTAPTGLAAPTSAFWAEVSVIALLYAIYVVFMLPTTVILRRRLPRLTGFFQRRVKLPFFVRIATLVIALGAVFIFGFWMIADVLGGLNGYGYSFITHPLLTFVYNTFGLQYVDLFMRDIHQSSAGAEASLFFLIAIIGLAIFQLNRGIGTALRDTITLFAAPCLIAFELALWYFAIQDMSWHVATFLSIGGLYDGGYRARSGGEYLVSNWFVLSVAIGLVATRLPGLAWPSKSLWKNRKSNEKFALARPQR